MIRIAITDDHTLITEGIKTMLRTSTGYEVMDTYSNIRETLSGLHRNLPDLLLLDINLPDGSGIEACKELLKSYPKLKVIALTNYEDTSFVKQIIKNGAKGYLLKNTTKEELVAAMETTLKGETYLSNKMQQRLLNESLGQRPSSFIPKLTRREKEVLQLIIEEYTTEEIGEKLCITAKTVEAHRSNLIHKLGVRNTAGLVRIAFEKGLV